MTHLEPFHPSDGAHLNHRDLSPAQDPPHENHMPDNHMAKILPAYRGDKSQLKVLLPGPSADDHQPNGPPPPPVWLVRDFDKTKEEKVQAYGEQPGKETFDIGYAKNRHRPVDWGKIHYCVVYERVGPDTFQALTQYVAVKTLKKSAVRRRLLYEGSPQNPYREAARMQQIGDDEHVLDCIECLEDNDYLYIVTRMALGGSLEDAIEMDNPDPEDLMEIDRVQTIFWKILKILGYLEEKGICHHDLSPGNFLFLTDDNLVVFDLEFSIPIPVHNNGQRSLIKPQGSFGTPAFMAPEIYKDEKAFDGVAADLYSATVILYSLLTNQYLYYRPTSSVDERFRFFVADRQLSNNPSPHFAESVALMAAEPYNMLTRHEKMQRRFGLGLKTFFGNMLAIKPENRSSLADAMNELVRLSNANSFP